MSADTAHYPISIDEIHERVEKKRCRAERRRPKISAQLPPLSGSCRERDNVKVIENEFGEEIIRVDGTIDPDLPVKTGDRFLLVSYDQTVLTHGLHKYPAKFFPELPRWLIQRYTEPGDLVLDPFSGSGTTNLEALLGRRHSVGVDVDPFSRFIARVKTTPLDADLLERCKSRLIEEAVNYQPSSVQKTEIPLFPYRDNWFNREISLELTYLLASIDRLQVDEPVKDFFRVCLSSTIRSVSNADDNCTRTVIRKKLNKIVVPSEALRLFVETILLNVPKMADFSRMCPVGYRVEFPDDMDARRIGFPDGTFDFAATSPPYANAVDYPRTHQLEMYWLGFANGSLTPLKKKHVGTESVSAKDYKECNSIGIGAADKVLRRIYESDPRRSFIAFKYLVDMEQNLQEVRRVLKKGGRYAVVVGNNRIRGELFENWKYIMAMGERLGFRIDTMFGSEIIKHFIKVPREERINTDWVVVFRK